MKRGFKFILNIKTKLALQFMALVSVILFLFAFIVYYFTYTTHKEKFRTSLLNRATYTTIVLSKSKSIETEFLDKVFTSTYTAQDQEVVICDTGLHILYNYNQNLITTENLRIEKYAESPGFFTSSEKDGVSLKFTYHGSSLMIVLMAKDNARINNLKELSRFLFWGILLSLILTMAMSYLFSKQALIPISEIIQEVKRINAGNLSFRLDEGEGKDELEQLACTFNTMLDGLEHSFKNQAEFIANASHELKTPLSVMQAESEYLLSKDQTREVYTSHLKKNIEYIKRFTEHLNNLLELAKINQITNIEKHPVRIDDIIYDSIKIIRDKYPGRKIIPKIALPEDDSFLIINANYNLMVLSISNLLDNACKFSSEEIVVSLDTTENLTVTITDKGIGIPESELDQINKPYKRAENARYIGGFGIGLSLVNRILEVHNFDFQINSVVNRGTSLCINFSKSRSS